MAHAVNLHFLFSHHNSASVSPPTHYPDPITQSPSMTTIVKIGFRHGRFNTAYNRTLDGYLTEAEFARRISALNAAARTERLKGSGSVLALFCTLLVIIFLFTLLLVLRGITKSTVTSILVVGIPVVLGFFLVFCVWAKLYKDQFLTDLDGICDRLNAQDYNKRIYYQLDKVFDHEATNNYRPELVISLGYQLPQVVTATEDTDTLNIDQVDALPLYTLRQATPDVIVHEPSQPPPIPYSAPPKYIP